jgi:hypothetical protein
VFPIPAVAEPLALAIRDAAVFTRPTYRRFLGLMLGLIVTMGRRTVSHALAVMRPTALGRRLPGHWSDYHRLFSAARFSMWTLAAVLVRQVVMRLLLPADAVIELAADDTVLGKDGDHVWAKAAHRDPTRSSRKKAAIRFGHKWLALCVLVQLPGLDRPWALPILCGLCLSPKAAAKVKRRPKTPSQLARQLLMRLMRWLPDRRFILIGDYQIVTHQTAEFARRHADRVTAIGRLRGDANLYAQPADRRSAGRGIRAKAPSCRRRPSRSPRSSRRPRRSPGTAAAAAASATSASRRCGTTSTAAHCRGSRRSAGSACWATPSTVRTTRSSSVLTRRRWTPRRSSSCMRGDGTSR